MATLSTPRGEFLRSMISAGVYKPGQGKYARWGTFAAIVALIATGFYTWTSPIPVEDWQWKWAIPLPIMLILIWFAYRTVQFPRFADFLITTESEMAKVKWPTWHELRVATVVVLFTVILLAVFLFFTDMAWQFILSLLGILRVPLGFGTNM